MEYPPIDTVRIDKKFCGPPKSGNGGYVCGILAKYIDGVAEVSLRQPPPLNSKLQVVKEQDQIKLFKGKVLIAEAKPSSLTMDVPSAPGPSTAELASRSYAGFKDHYFPSCFVCGPQRAEGDGLRIFAGPTPNGQIVASPWAPHDSLFDKNGELSTEFYWAALDCPGAYAVHESKESMKVLGRLTTKIEKVITKGERLIVTGWDLGSDGRKFYSGTAIYEEDGTLKAFAQAIWIEINKKSF